MRTSILLILGRAFIDACLETPRGMIEPFVAFAKVAIRNPVLEAKRESRKSRRSVVAQ